MWMYFSWFSLRLCISWCSLRLSSEVADNHKCSDSDRRRNAAAPHQTSWFGRASVCQHPTLTARASRTTRQSRQEGCDFVDLNCIIRHSILYKIDDRSGNLIPSFEYLMQLLADTTRTRGKRWYHLEADTPNQWSYCSGNCNGEHASRAERKVVTDIPNQNQSISI